MRLAILISLVVIFVTVVAAQLLWLDIQPPGKVELTIPKGISSAEIGRRLEKAGVIRSATAFRILARISGAASELQSGHYRFQSPADLWDVLARIRAGDAILYSVTVPEGLRTDEVLALLARETGTDVKRWHQALRQLLGDKDHEGRLLPETYAYHRPVAPKDILKSMLQGHAAVMQKLTPAWLDTDKLRIMASIVEKETSVDDERPLVAAVIRNRLKQNMALQMDPTVIYGLWRVDGYFSGNLRRADMSRDTPWNTYTRKGLPPTPICNPGKASLKAAAHPAKVDYLYFVADGTGGHVFASTLEAHQKNVRKWIRIERRMQKGK